LAGQVVLLVVALGVVAELALEDAAAGRLQQEHFLVGGVEDAGQVRRAEFGEVGQRRAEGGPAGGGGAPPPGGPRGVNGPGPAPSSRPSSNWANVCSPSPMTAKS